ncbi:MAG TPA: HutP family protein [Clostridia bacterium]|nr:HutP family protein [Clostridia bacterium]
MDILKLDYSLNDLDIGRLAVLIAMSTSREQESQIKKTLANLDYKFCITEVGGERLEFNKKLYKAVIGATLNNKIIVKNSHEVHALLHATEEAKKGFLFKEVSSLNVAVKIAIVRKDHWLAVGMYGYSAMHSITNHSRVGLGLMHI